MKFRIKYILALVSQAIQQQKTIITVNYSKKNIQVLKALIDFGIITSFKVGDKRKTHKFIIISIKYDTLSRETLCYVSKILKTNCRLNIAKSRQIKIPSQNFDIFMSISKLLQNGKNDEYAITLK